MTFDPQQITVKLSAEALSQSEVVALLKVEDNVGATVLFTGHVRDKAERGDVLRLEFEAYEAMAKKEMQTIAANALQRWPLKHVAIHHRIGICEATDIPVIIGVSSAHRKEAFAACEFCIDELKKTVPIWKKEVFKDGHVWVSAHP